MIRPPFLGYVCDSFTLLYTPEHAAEAAFPCEVLGKLVKCEKKA